MNYTEEIYEMLTPYRTHLYTATYGNYVRFKSIQEKKELAAIYTKHFNKKSRLDKGCGGCTLNEMKQLGRLYFADEEIYKVREGLEQNKETETEEVEVQTVTKNKTVKRSQKKKE